MKETALFEETAQIAGWLKMAEAVSGGLAGLCPTRPNPRKTLITMLQGYIQPQLIYVAAKLGLPDLLAHGPQSFAQLAAELEAEPEALRRVLNGLVGIGILEHAEAETFSLTQLGECLVSDQPNSLREVAILLGEEFYAAWGQLLHTVRTGQPAFKQVLGREFFAYLSQHPPVSRRFNTFMTNTTNWAAQALSEAYDFSQVQKVIDVGGGSGRLLANLLQAHPHLQATLFDITLQSEPARQAVEEYFGDCGLAGRCQVVGGDFFQALPALEDGTALLLSQILHDWNDVQAIGLLKICRRAAGQARNTRLLLFENVLPQAGPLPYPMIEQDLVMLVLTGGRERTAREFEHLLACAGWHLESIVATRHSRSILQAYPV